MRRLLFDSLIMMYVHEPRVDRLLLIRDLQIGSRAFVGGVSGECVREQKLFNCCFEVSGISGMGPVCSFCLGAIVFVMVLQFTYTSYDIS